MQELKIGRNNECDIVINDQTVSRMHATLIIKNDGYYVRDEGSANGTFINGNKISGQFRLKENDILKVGNTVVPWRKHIPAKATIKPPVVNQPPKPEPQPMPNGRKKKSATTIILVGGGILILLAALVLYFFYISQKDELRISAAWVCDKNCGTINTVIFSDNENKKGDYTYITKNTLVDSTKGTYYINTEDGLLRLSVGLLTYRDSIGKPQANVLYKYKFKKNTLSLFPYENGTGTQEPIILIKKR